MRGNIAGVIAVICSAATASAQSTSQQLVPLHSYIDGKDFAHDPGALEYVFLRCSSLYMAYAAVLDPETAPNRVALKNTSLKVSGDLLAGAVKVEMQGTTTKMEDAFKAAGQTVTKISGAYLDVMKNARVYSGDFSKDPTINGDIEVCKPLVDELSGK